MTGASLIVDGGITAAYVTPERLSFAIANTSLTSYHRRMVPAMGR